MNNNIPENLFDAMYKDLPDALTEREGGEGVKEAAERAVGELSGKEAFAVYSDTLMDALNRIAVENIASQAAINAFKTACTGNEMGAIVPPIRTSEDAKIAKAVIDALQERIISQLFTENPENTDRESEESKALEQELAEYEEKCDKLKKALDDANAELDAAQGKVEELQEKLGKAALKTDEGAIGEPFKGLPEYLFTDTDKWGGVFSDIRALIDEEDGGEPLNDFEAALAVKFCGIHSKGEFDAIGGFVNEDFVAELKSMLVRVKEGRNKRVLIPPLQFVYPYVCDGWQEAFSAVRAYAYVTGDAAMFSMSDTLLYGKLREVYAQTDSLGKFTPNSVLNGFMGKINGFIQNLQTPPDAKPAAEIETEPDEDDGLPFVMDEDENAGKKNAVKSILAAQSEADEKIREGLKSYKENPEAWKPLIEKRRKDSGTDAEQYPDADIVNDLLVENPTLRPEGVAPAKEAPDFKGFLQKPTLPLTSEFFDSYAKNWIDPIGVNYKERMAFISDVKPILMKDATIAAILDPKRLEVDERLFVAMAACGGLISYRTALNLLKYKEDGGEWQKAYRKFVGAVALACCVQMTERDGLGENMRTYKIGKISQNTGTPEWVDAEAQDALKISGYSQALVSLKLETRRAAKNAEEPASEAKIADRDCFFYDRNSFSYFKVSKGEPLEVDASCEEVTEQVFKDGTENNAAPQKAKLIPLVRKACRLWELVPAEIAWEKAFDESYNSEWEALIRAYAKAQNNPAVITSFERNPKGTLKGFQTAYKRGHTIEQAFRDLLGEKDFNEVAPWEPRETKGLSEECAAVSKAWYEYVEEQE